MGAALVSLGKTMLVGMDEGGDAERYVDEKLLEVDSRLSDLVTPVKGKINSKENEVEKVSVFFLFLFLT